MIIADMLPTDSTEGAVRLTDWGLIRAQGADAASFLHGQLTQDVLHLPEGTALLAGYCSAKGRLLASFVVWRGGADEILLACSADLLAQTLKRLSMFVLRAKCKLSDASADLALWGVAGASAPAAMGLPASAAWTVLRTPALSADKQAGTTAIRLPDACGVARWLWVQPAQSAAPAPTALDMEAWRWLEVCSGVARIQAATVEQFVPQMVNLELVGGVNFQKGCYPGQEVVARSQYRGTLKRRSLRYESSAALGAGQEVFDPADPGQPAGQVVLAAGSSSGRYTALVEVKLGAASSALHLSSAQGPVLEPADLPYPLPNLEAEAT